MKSVQIIALLVTVLSLTLCGCSDTCSPIAPTASSDQIWYNPYEEDVSVLEIDTNYAYVISRTLTDYVAKYSQSVSDEDITEILNVYRGLEQFGNSTSDYGKYITSLAKLFECYYGFYNFNSTDTMLDEHINKVEEAFSAMTPQNQSQYYKPDKAQMKQVGKVIAEFAAAKIK